MRHKFIILAFVAVAAITLSLLLMPDEQVVVSKAKEGTMAPDFALRDLEGHAVRLSDYRGKVVLVNFWATWCDSCRQENPAFQKLIESQNGSSDLVILKILFRDSAANAINYLKQNGFAFNVLLDSDGTFAKYGITGVPETFIISRQGLLLRKVVGPRNWDSAEVKAVLRRIATEI